MAKIPTRVSQVIPSGRVAGAVIPFDIADTGQGIEAQGLAGLGRGVGDLGISLGRIAFAEGTSQADSARVAAGSRINLLETELSTITDTEQYDAKLKEALEDIEILRPDHVIGGKQFDDFLERTIPQWQTGVNILKIKQTQSNIEGRYILDLNEARTLGRLDLANQLTINARDKTGAITPEQAARDLVTNESFISKLLQNRVIDNASQIGFDAWQATITPENLGGDKKAGFAAIQALDISGDDKALAESKLNVQVNNRRAEDKVKAEQATTESVEQINKRLNERNFADIIPFINTLPLSETQKTEQILKATHFAEAVNSTKENIVTTDETNIAIDRNLNNLRKGEITYDEGLDIYRKLAKKINAKEGEQNLDDIRTAADAAVDPVLKRPVVVDGQASVDRIRAVRVGFVRADDTLDDTERAVLISEIEREVLADKTELDQWARENADKPNFSQEFQKQVNAINRPKVEKVTLGFFNRVLRGSEETLFFGVVPKFAGTSEEAALARKRMKSLEENAPDIFNTLTEEEKASILERFKRGATVQEIIDLAK